MKEATGELNMTVITVIAIAAVAALFYAFVWPMIQRTIVDRTCKSIGTTYEAYECGTAGSGTQCNITNDENTKFWACCKNGDPNQCVPAD